MIRLGDVYVRIGDQVLRRRTSQCDSYVYMIDDPDVAIDANDVVIVVGIEDQHDRSKDVIMMLNDERMFVQQTYYDETDLPTRYWKKLT